MMTAISFEEIIENFEFLDDWEDRYRYVIELGKNMGSLDNSLKVPATKVDGCASQVWIVPVISGSGKAAKFSFQGDSDAMIVRGLIAILTSLYNNLTIEEVVKLDAFNELKKLELNNHLSAQRSNGLAAMVKRIKEMTNKVEV
jgi:cysteine desulfuration protein SufE